MGLKYEPGQSPSTLERYKIVNFGAVDFRESGELLFFFITLKPRVE